MPGVEVCLGVRTPSAGGVPIVPMRTLGEAFGAGGEACCKALQGRVTGGGGGWEVSGACAKLVVFEVLDFRGFLAAALAGAEEVAEGDSSGDRRELISIALSLRRDR